MSYIMSFVLLIASISCHAIKFDVGLGAFQNHTDKRITRTVNYKPWSGMAYANIQNTLFSHFNGHAYFESSLDRQTMRNGENTNYQDLALSINSLTDYYQVSIQPSLGIGVIKRKNQSSHQIKKQPYAPIAFNMAMNMTSDLNLKMITGYDYFFFFPHDNHVKGFKNIKGRYHFGKRLTYKHAFIQAEYNYSTFKSHIGYNGPDTRGLKLSLGYSY